MYSADRLAAALLSGTHRGTTFDVAEGDAALGQIVRRKLERNLVARKNADVMLAHLAVGVGHEFVTVVEFNAVASIGEHFKHLTRHLNEIFLCHSLPKKKAASRRRKLDPRSRADEAGGSSE